MESEWNECAYKPYAISLNTKIINKNKHLVDN